jgi:hypothetical protein
MVSVPPQHGGIACGGCQQPKVPLAFARILPCLCGSEGLPAQSLIDRRSCQEDGKGGQGLAGVGNSNSGQCTELLLAR